MALSRHLISALLLLLLSTSLPAMQLPAVRRTAAEEEKRALASRLLRNADVHKRSSLRDVLEENAIPSPGKPKPESVKVSKPPEQPEQRQPASFRSVSQLFAWAITNTGSLRRENKTIPLSITLSSTSRTPRPSAHSSVESNQRPKELPSRPSRTMKPPESEHSSKSIHPSSSSHIFQYTEFDVLLQNVNVLKTPTSRVSHITSALLRLEELCHSTDNGRDLQSSGGIEPLVNALNTPNHLIRANAAWALATCCQNNPPVQNASLQLDAVPTLARLASTDEEPVVRAKALFALNSILELEEARVVFEQLPSSIHTLKRSLNEKEDVRATRRALNLAELLLTKNLDAWKTMLEAWDVPYMVERLMREHHDLDVRESAARTIAALDGKQIS